MNWRGPTITAALAILWALTGSVVFGIILSIWLLVSVVALVITR